MIITFANPKVSPQFTSYITTTFPLTIQVGFSIAGVTNVGNLTDNRNWILLDSNGIVIQSGIVNVLLNTFQSSVSFNNLSLGQIYSFQIINPNSSTTSSTIFTFLDMSNIQVIDENYIFSNPIRIYGDLVFQNENGNSVHFPSDWDVMRTIGNGIILESIPNGSQQISKYNIKFYAYAPSAMYTLMSNVPSSIMFSPLPGLLTINIPIYQNPFIREVGSLLYEIIPPTKLSVVFNGKQYSINSAVSTLDMKSLTDDKVGMIQITPIF